MLGGGDNSPATGDAYVGAYKSIAWTGVPLNAKFFFQLVFAGTAATIVSGAVAERIKYLVLHRLFVPAGGLRLSDHRPLDLGRRLAGDGRVLGLRRLDRRAQRRRLGRAGRHPVLGPRLGKYGPDGQVNPIPAHSMTSGVIGCFVLWLGWFGFNPGSTMAADAERDRAHLHDDQHGGVHGCC